jgi:hypothetical protein
MLSENADTTYDVRVSLVDGRQRHPGKGCLSWILHQG